MTEQQIAAQWGRIKDAVKMQQDHARLLSDLRRQAIEQWQLEAQATQSWQDVESRRDAIDRSNRAYSAYLREMKIASRQAQRIHLDIIRAEKVYLLHYIDGTLRNRMWSSWRRLVTRYSWTKAVRGMNQKYVDGLNQRSWMFKMMYMDHVPSPTSGTYQKIIEGFEVIPAAGGEVLVALKTDWAAAEEKAKVYEGGIL